MAAYLLGICYEFNDNSVPSFDKTNLQSLIISRIGVDNFTSRIDRMRESKHFQKADLHFEPVDSDKNPSTLVYFDYNVVELIKSTSGLFFLILDSLCKSATTVKKKKLPETTQVIEKAVVLEYENKIAYQDEVINELKNQVIKLKNQIVALDKSYKDQIASMEVNIASDVTEDSSTRLAELTREQEDLLICLAEQDVEVQSLKERLRTYGEDIPYDD